MAAQVLVDLSPASGIADAKRNSLFFRFCGVSRQIGVPLTEDMQKPRLLEWPARRKLRANDTNMNALGW